MLYSSSFQLCFEVGIGEYLLLEINGRLQSGWQLFRGAGSKQDSDGQACRSSEYVGQKSLRRVFYYHRPHCFCRNTPLSCGHLKYELSPYSSPSHASVYRKINPVGISIPQRGFQLQTSPGTLWQISEMILIPLKQSALLWWWCYYYYCYYCCHHHFLLLVINTTYFLLFKVCSDQIPSFLMLSGGIYWQIMFQHIAISCATTLGIMKYLSYTSMTVGLWPYSLSFT